MKKEDYEKIVNKFSMKEKKASNIFVAFITGGIIGLVGELSSNILVNSFGVATLDSYMIISLVLVVLGSLLTGLGVFDKIASFSKAGVIVPTTGFSHAMTCAAMDYRKEGLTKGIGSNMFKLTGSIIIYTVIVSFFVALIKGVII